MHLKQIKKSLDAYVWWCNDARSNTENVALEIHSSIHLWNWELCKNFISKTWESSECWKEYALTWMGVCVHGMVMEGERLGYLPKIDYMLWQYATHCRPRYKIWNSFFWRITRRFILVLHENSIVMKCLCLPQVRKALGEILTEYKRWTELIKMANV